MMGLFRGTKPPSPFAAIVALAVHPPKPWTTDPDKRLGKVGTKILRVLGTKRGLSISEICTLLPANDKQAIYNAVANLKRTGHVRVEGERGGYRYFIPGKTGRY